MKQFIFILALVFVSQPLFSQDTIVLKTNTKVVGYITQMTPIELKYKRENAPGELERSIALSRIKLLKYKNGKHETIDWQPAPPSPVYTPAINEIVYPKDTIPLSNKIEYVWSSSYLYKAKVIEEHEAFAIMNKTNDEKIMQLIHQSKNAKQLSRLGYLAIPALIGALTFEEYSISQVYRRNGTTDTKKKSNYQLEAYSCFVVTIACPVVSLIMKRKYKRTRTEALKLYNEKY